MRQLSNFKYSLPASMLLAAILLVPTLKTGLFASDFFHKAFFTGLLPSEIAPQHPLFGMFSFSSGSEDRMRAVVSLGAAPWWSDLNVKIMFFRPLSELTHWLDYKLWPEQPAIMHLENILWYLLDICIAGLFIRSLYRDKKVAIPALFVFMYAVCGAHSLAVTWIADRNALISTFFGILAILCHQRWREKKQITDLLLSLTSLLAALLAAEYGISCIPFLMSYALILEKGNFKKRIISITPALIITLLYLLFYVKEGFGTKNSELYLSPVTDLKQFLTAASIRVPELLAS
ncbi:MAG TPA: hypothetical protein VFM46_13075, partial [Pseudomonadales bacterium]|nr:hypothetical protein [Pseudomonadales bacterium]